MDHNIRQPQQARLTASMHDLLRRVATAGYVPNSGVMSASELNGADHRTMRRLVDAGLVFMSGRTESGYAGSSGMQYEITDTGRAAITKAEGC